MLPKALLLCLVLLSAFAMAGEESLNESSTCVVLLHGLWRTSLSMKALEWRLEDAGYAVVNTNYSSLASSLQEMSALAVDEGLAGCAALHLARIDFVTHSLGGILVRQYLEAHEIPALQRVVMLGPPNQGSELADYADSLALLQPFLPRAVAQLGTSEASVPRQLGRVSFQLGVIAGTANHLPFLPGQPDGLGDGTVAVRETIVPGMMDFLELPVTHSFMMWNNEVLEQVLFFLEHGVFKRQSPPFSAP